MIRHLRKSLVTGVVVLVPIVVTIKVLQILFNFTDGILGNAVTRILNRPIPGLGLLLFLILIYLVGIIYRTFFGKRMLVWTEQVIEMIPVARTIYSGVKQLVGPFVGDEPTSIGVVMTGVAIWLGLAGVTLVIAGEEP